MTSFEPLARSSGDALADRRADYAEMLLQSGDAAAAADLMLQAMEIAPGWTLGWFRLGEMHEAAGQVERAVEAWRMTLALDPDDQAGAGLKLALADAAKPPARPPSAFVEALFDEYASSFDVSLVEKLDYRAPELIYQALQRHAPGRRFGRAVDLGCGTGLMGEQLRQAVDDLAGYDISAEMLNQAEAKNIYDRLEKADLQTIDGSDMRAGLVTAADVFMYLGALEPMFAAVARMLEPGGLFAFSVEAHDGTEDLILRESRRYAHSEAYLRRLLENAGFELASLQRDDIRMDRNQPIQGLIVVAAKRRPALAGSHVPV